MEVNEKDASIPPNYVTLLQLQERWIKAQQEKQNQNQKLQGQEEEDQEPEETQQQKVQVPTIKGYGGKPNADDRRGIGSSTFRDSSKATHHPSMATHHPTGDVTGGKSFYGKKRIRKKNKGKRAEASAPEKQETSGNEAHSLPILSEEVSVPAREYGKTREMSIEKIDGVVKQRDLMAVVESKTKNVSEASDRMVEVNGKFGELMMEKNKTDTYRPNRVFNPSKYEHRGGNVRVFGNRNDRDYGGYNSGYYGANRGYYRHYYSSGRGRGRFNGRGGVRMWVRKEEAAHGGGVSESGGSGILLKEEEEE
ncbi:hypothetical protein K2173_008071 [Erythroxylum novogranatense]|uniref:Uncharacterized protein n=1 Tax=Erythroxylum novogranatense TaxID=1862640 RepID=A0AAV8T7G3_9ROSI|nr:hypothetical protein K2173_008071 [Erythroxylum novogranatense]